MRLVNLIIAVVAGLLAVVAAAYAYLLYSPWPERPALSAHADPIAIRVGQNPRTYVEYVPAKLPAGAPLVIVLHGAKMTGAMMRRWTGYEFDSLADKHGFAVFYPDGFEHNWNDCRKAGNFSARTEHIDDLAFMHALIASAKQKFGIDPAKVYIAGYSNGGHMAMALAAQSPSPVAGIAIFAAALPTADNSNCPQQTVTPPVMIVDGTADPVSPYNGGEVNLFGFSSRGNVMSARASAEEFAKRNGISAPPVEDTLAHINPEDPTSVQRLTWSRAGKPYIVLYTVNGGGHTVPQSAFTFPRLLGPTTGDLDGPARTVEFFLQ